MRLTPLLLIVVIAVLIVPGLSCDSGKIVQLEGKIVGLEASQKILEDELSRWQTDCASLQHENDALQTENGSLQQANAQLQSEKSSLQTAYSSWQQTNTQLQSQKSTLQAAHDAMLDEYDKMRKAINQRHGEAADRKLFVTPDDPDVAATVLAVTGGFSENVSEQWADYRRLYDWVVNNIQYSYDSPLPFLPASPSLAGLSWYSDCWRMPSETLMEETGDCEDMATLLASMIMDYTSGRYACWVVTWHSESTGHAAVAFPVESDNLTILDPAGKYYTNKPYSLGSLPVSTAVDKWLSQWPGEPGIHVSGVFSNTICETFGTTSEFVQWVLDR